MLRSIVDESGALLPELRSGAISVPTLISE
jgi:hypothetical protein